VGGTYRGWDLPRVGPTVGGTYRGWDLPWVGPTAGGTYRWWDLPWVGPSSFDSGERLGAGGSSTMTRATSLARSHVQPSAAECSRVQPSVAECSRVQPSAAACSRVQPSGASLTNESSHRSSFGGARDPAAQLGARKRSRPSTV